MQFIRRHAHYFDFAVGIIIFFNCINASAQTGQPQTNYPDTTAILKEIQIAKDLTTPYPDSALKKYSAILEHSRKARFSNGVATAFYAMGSIYNTRNFYDSAITYYKQALQFSTGKKELATTLPLLNVEIAEAYQSKGEYELAVRFFYQALSANKKLSIKLQTDKEEADINIALAAIFSLMGQYEKANLFLDRAGYLAKKNKDAKLIASILLQKGVMACEQPGKLQESIKYFEEALAIAEQNQYHNVEFIAVGNLGVVYCQSHNIPKAIKQAEKMSVLIEKGFAGNTYLKIGAIVGIGEIYLSARQYDKGESNLLKALKLAGELGVEQHQLDAHAALYKLYKEKHLYYKALKHHEAYALLKDQLGGRDVNKHINELEVKYRTAEKDKSIINNQLLIERQNNKISRGKTINTIGIAIFVVLLVCLSLLIRLYRNRSLLRKKKVEILEQEQEIVQLKGIMLGEQGERLRIAGELHDGIGGILAVLKMKFNSTWKENPGWSDSNAFKEIDQLIEHTSDEIRRTSHNLMPDALTKYTLKDALIMYRDDVCSAPDGVFVELVFIGDDINEINNTMSLVVYRMIQEIIMNILKHARATQAIIQVIYKEKCIKIIAEDDGIGFDPDAGNHGIGLKTLQSRINALHGNITINSGPGKGTIIFIEVDTNIIS